uniref:HNH endonuclease n=1 Tax=Steinernema glaseri TaxID=37863 RepID=A0A1I7ZXB1_9BILA
MDRGNFDHRMRVFRHRDEHGRFVAPAPDCQCTPCQLPEADRREAMHRAVQERDLGRQGQGNFDHRGNVFRHRDDHGNFCPPPANCPCTPCHVNTPAMREAMHDVLEERKKAPQQWK